MTGYVGLQSYNTDFKMCQNYITIRNYELPQLRGYGKDSNVIPVYSEEGLGLDQIYSMRKRELEKMKLEYFKAFGSYDYEKYMDISKYDLEYIEFQKNYEKERRENFYKSVRRSKTNVIDLVACNTYKHKSYTGTNERTKFMTLTFKDRVTDVKKAYGELTKYMKRLSYKLYNVKVNVLKYICVAELQKRGAWHFHIILFNMPYIEHSELLSAWGNGTVGINGIKGSAGYVARYVAKYMAKGVEITEEGELETKEEEGDKIITYEVYKKLGLENMKRYTCSRGLFKPKKYNMFFTEDERNDIIKTLTRLDMLETLDKEGNLVNVVEYDHEERGNIQKIEFIIKPKYIEDVNKLLFSINMTYLQRRTYKKRLSDEEYVRKYYEGVL